MSQPTFASLCRASKRFLPLARSFLYYRPISPTSTVTWKRARALLASLSSATGQLVVSLEGIVDYVAELGTLKEPRLHLSFQLRGLTKALSLYIALLSACPRLVTVELIFNSSQHWTKLLKALTKSRPTLQTVVFANSRYSRDYQITTELACSAMNHSQLSGIQNVVLRHISRTVSVREPAVSLTLGSFTLQTVEVLDFFKVLFPRDPSALQSFSLQTEAMSQYFLSWILEYLPDSLQDLSIDVNDDYPPPSLFDYEYRRIRSLDPSHFAHLTSLTRLCLQGFQGPSLDLLDQLASSCATLSELDFARSPWVPSSVTRSSSVSAPRHGHYWIMGVADPRDLLARLVKFARLRHAHLGYLPTMSRARYAEMLDEMARRGVEIEWQPCTDPPFCPGCGDYHHY
ncbi:hypothetical protein JCM11491_001804 [Sporobolomyces phaffii]